VTDACDFFPDDTRATVEVVVTDCVVVASVSAEAADCAAAAAAAAVVSAADFSVRTQPAVSMRPANTPALDKSLIGLFREQ
jgi:hypothetical protein